MAITYSISGGADAAKFSLDAATGKLVFKAAPDFEAPGDANKDNVYELTVKVTDTAGKTTTKDFRVTCTDIADMTATSPPQITSTGTASVPENNTFVMTVTAVEADTSTAPPVTPPVDPPPAQDTSGKITKFATKSTMIDADCYDIYSAYKPYSVTQVDDYELRFEVRQGERMSGDGDYCERSEIQRMQSIAGLPKFSAVGSVVSYTGKLFIEPGESGASYFFVLVQAHNDDNAYPGGAVPTSPPIAVEFIEERIKFLVRSCAPGKNPSNNAGNVKLSTLWTDPGKTARGVWHDLKVEAKNTNASNGGGYCKCWFDGTQVADYIGPVGFGYSLYWEMGPYRATDPTVFAAHFRNIVMT